MKVLLESLGDMCGTDQVLGSAPDHTGQVGRDAWPQAAVRSVGVPVTVRTWLVYRVISGTQDVSN